MEAFCLGFPSIHAKFRHTRQFSNLRNSSVSTILRHEKISHPTLLRDFETHPEKFYYVPAKVAKKSVKYATTSSVTQKDSATKQQRQKIRKKISPEASRSTGNPLPLKRKLVQDSKSEVSYQNGDPLGRRELGKHVIRWIAQGMAAMASDFSAAEEQSDVGEFEQKMASSVTFILQAQPYLTAIPMPKGLEAVCLKASTHYPTLLDHFQRELREKLQALQAKSIIQDWRETESWRLLKQLASSVQHRSIARKAFQPKQICDDLGLPPQKTVEIQKRIDDFVAHMSKLLRIERDAELEATQEELDAAPSPDVSSGSARAIEYLVSHGQSEQEQCDTICNLNAVSSSTGLGGMHLVSFSVEGGHRLPPTTISPGDMVCVRVSDSRGAGATSCVQGFVHSLGEDGCSITVALESRYGVPTFSKLFGKSLRIDRIHSLADAITYEASGNC